MLISWTFMLFVAPWSLLLKVTADSALRPYSLHRRWQCAWHPSGLAHRRTMPFFVHQPNESPSCSSKAGAAAQHKIHDMTFSIFQVERCCCFESNHTGASELWGKTLWWSATTQFSWIQTCLRWPTECGGMWRDVEGCGGMWRDVEGCGGMWGPKDVFWILLRRRKARTWMTIYSESLDTRRSQMKHETKIDNS